jgi:hypothetical protein
MRFSIYESPEDDCEETFVIENSNSWSRHIYCDDCGKKHTFILIAQQEVTEENLWSFLEKLEDD